MERIITNNEVLGTYPANIKRVSTLKLCKQSYSDGSCFYTLQDSAGNWRVHHGSRSLQELIDQLKHEIRIEIESSEEECIKSNPEVFKVYDQLIKRKQKIVTDMKLIKKGA